MRFPSIIAAVSLMSVLPAVSNANLLVNGGFESPALSATFAVYNQGADIGGWTVVGTGDPVNSMAVLRNDYMEYAGTLAFSPHGGIQSLDITGAANRGFNGVRQSVTTTVGADYEISFWVGNQDAAFPAYTLASAISLDIDGTSVGTFSNADNTSADVNWKQFTYGFQATSGTTTITFYNVTPSDDMMAGLDDVVLTSAAIPEPTSLALLTFGVLGTIRLRRRNGRIGG